ALPIYLVGDGLGEELLHPVQPGVLVVADLALDVDLRALAQVLAGDLAELAEEGHPVPLGVFLRIAVAVLAYRRRGEADLGDRHAALGVPGLGGVAELADEDRLVDATCHGNGPGFRVESMPPQGRKATQYTGQQQASAHRQTAARRVGKHPSGPPEHTACPGGAGCSALRRPSSTLSTSPRSKSLKSCSLDIRIHCLVAA